jgi:type IV pilus assembly protein PilX
MRNAMNLPACSLRPSRAPRRQRGIVLIVAMVMLVVISLLASLSIRNALSSEGVSGNVRVTELASQAAETALKVCENAVSEYALAGTAMPTGMTALGVVSPARYTDMATWWDAASIPAGIYVVPAEKVNTGGSADTYARMPECMIERMYVMSVDNTVRTDTRTYMITARGFGPDVKNTTGRPEGTEVFLQSVLEVD